MSLLPSPGSLQIAFWFMTLRVRARSNRWAGRCGVFFICPQKAHVKNKKDGWENDCQRWKQQDLETSAKLGPGPSWCPLWPRAVFDLNPHNQSLLAPWVLSQGSFLGSMECLDPLQASRVMAAAVAGSVPSGEGSPHSAQGHPDLGDCSAIPGDFGVKPACLRSPSVPAWGTNLTQNPSAGEQEKQFCSSGACPACELPTWEGLR